MAATGAWSPGALGADPTTCTAPLGNQQDPWHTPQCYTAGTHSCFHSMCVRHWPG